MNIHALIHNQWHLGVNRMLCLTAGDMYRYMAFNPYIDMFVTLKFKQDWTVGATFKSNKTKLLSAPFIIQSMTPELSR